METRLIKEKTIKKCLAVLKEMKYMADNNLSMSTDGIAKKYHTNGSIPSAAKDLNYFEKKSVGIWVCNKNRFDPIDARTVLYYIYDHYQNKHKDKRDTKGHFLKGNIPYNKPGELYNIDREVKQIEVRQIKFIPPSIQEVRDYCELRGNDIDPEAFISYYKSKDWMVGKKKMKKWRMAINTWEQNQKRPNIVYVTKINEYSDNELIEELKKRGYKGGIQKDIEF